MIVPVPKSVTILDLKHSSDGAQVIREGRMIQSRSTTTHLDKLLVDLFVVASSTYIQLYRPIIKKKPKTFTGRPSVLYLYRLRIDMPLGRPKAQQRVVKCRLFSRDLPWRVFFNCSYS